MQVNHPVAGAAERPIGKQNLTVQSAELSPKNAVRLVIVLEHTLPPSQPTIESKNDLRPKRPLAANHTIAPFVRKGERNGFLAHRTPGESPLCGVADRLAPRNCNRASQFSIKSESMGVARPFGATSSCRRWPDWPSRGSPCDRSLVSRVWVREAVWDGLDRD